MKTKNLIAPSSSILLIRQSIVEIPLGRLQRRTWARWWWCWRNPFAWSCWRNPSCAAYAAAAWRGVRADYRAYNSRHTRHGPLSRGTNNPNALYVLGFDCAKCSVLGKSGCNCINKEVSCCFHVLFVFFFFSVPSLWSLFTKTKGDMKTTKHLFINAVANICFWLQRCPVFI